MKKYRIALLQRGAARKRFPLALALAFYCFQPAGAETLTLTTYYPAPYGGYVSILTTGKTYLARDTDYVTVGKGSDTTDKLYVGGNTKINDLYVLNAASQFVKFPRPPAGKTLEWLSVPLGTEVDSYSAGSPYTGAAHSDTCDGNTTAVYTCPNLTKKECSDVQVATPAVPVSCSRGTYTVCVGCGDTCPGGYEDSQYAGCPPYSCADCMKMGWPAIRHKAWIDVVPAVVGTHRDVAVECQTIQTVSVLVAK